jgi:hypothetical protein
MEETFTGYLGIKAGTLKLRRRFVQTLERFLKAPEQSVAAAMEDRHQAKAVYRMLDNEKLALGAIEDQIRRETVKTVEQHSEDVILVVQDTTDIDYGGLKKTTGLGHHGYTDKSNGLFLHSGLAVTENGQVLGLMYQKFWVRSQDSYGKADERKALPIEEKETIKWVEPIEEIKAISGKRLVYVGDRENDVYEVIARVGAKAIYLIRAGQVRRIKEDEKAKKTDSFRGKTAEMQLEMTLVSKTGIKRETRKVKIQIRYGKVKLQRPAKSSEQLAEEIETNVVIAEEVDAPKGVEPVFWQLYTNEEVTDTEWARRIVGWYCQRWKIERYQYVLKSGCKIEELREREAEKLKILIAMYSIVAVKLLTVLYDSRAKEEKSCDGILSEMEWQTLYRVVNKTKQLPKTPPTQKEAVRMLAKLGGFVGANTITPGIKVLWRGMTVLHNILSAIPYIDMFVGY